MEAVGVCQNAFNVNYIREENFGSDVPLSQQVKKSWETDFGDSISNPKPSMSVEDKRVLQMMEDTVELVEGHYQVGLPWQDQPPRLKNNQQMAQNRLECLK